MYTSCALHLKLYNGNQSKQERFKQNRVLTMSRINQAERKRATDANSVLHTYANHLTYGTEEYMAVHKRWCMWYCATLMTMELTQVVNHPFNYEGGRSLYEVTAGQQIVRLHKHIKDHHGVDMPDLQNV